MSQKQTVARQVKASSEDAIVISSVPTKKSKEQATDILYINRI